jgi:hypothetical protein
VALEGTVRVRLDPEMLQLVPDVVPAVSVQLVLRLLSLTLLSSTTPPLPSTEALNGMVGRLAVKPPVTAKSPAEYVEVNVIPDGQFPLLFLSSLYRVECVPGQAELF